MDGPFVRRATGADEAEWVDLYGSIAAERDWIGGEPPFESGRLQASFRARCRSRPGGLWVARAGPASEMVGWFDLRLAEDDWMYLGMGIAAHCRGRGLGRALLGRVDDVTTAAGAQGTQLHVFEHNERARRLYASAGYVETGTVSDVDRRDGRVFRSIEMRKQLAGSP